MKIMNRIKEHRERLGLSMAELAEKNRCRCFDGLPVGTGKANSKVRIN